jgi:hypothetical protein
LGRKVPVWKFLLRKRSPGLFRLSLSPEERDSLCADLNALVGLGYDVGAAQRAVLKLMLKNFRDRKIGIKAEESVPSPSSIPGVVVFPTYSAPPKKASPRKFLPKHVCTSAIMRALKSIPRLKGVISEAPLDMHSLGEASTNDFLTLAKRYPGEFAFSEVYPSARAPEIKRSSPGDLARKLLFTVAKGSIIRSRL